MHYYYQKYPYLNYNYRDTDGLWRMFSIPARLLADVFQKTFGCAPASFFDCGAATGVIVYEAQTLGMDARGIDIKKYPYQFGFLEDLFTSGKIQIKSILDCEPIQADLVYCNGTLTYFDQTQLPLVLEKFHNCKMLCAIHNTTEDIIAARKNGDELITCNKTRLIKTRQWWTRTFNKNGFETTYNENLRLFCVVPKYKNK